VVCNPPYRAVGHGRLNPHPEKAIARHELTVTLSQLVQAARHLLCRRGLLIMVYHPSRLPELFAQLEAAHLRPRRMRLVHATEQAPASMVLIEAIRDGRDALTVLPPLWVYEASGDYTTEMQAIFQGRAALNEAALRRRSRGERAALRPSADAVAERRALGDIP
jgi:tRNA1Val (adenine37-N6)-methyltransferase